YGAAPVRLHWSPGAESNTGAIIVPSFLPAGKYSLTVTAEDFAHNIGTQEVALEVAPLFPPDGLLRAIPRSRSNGCCECATARGDERLAEISGSQFRPRCVF